MPGQTNFNKQPYFDDFDPDKNFYRVMYKAGMPVQARELTTQQAIMQDQFEQFSSRFFKDGDNIVPGEFGLANPVDYVRLSSITQGSSIEDYVGYQVKGASSGVVANIILSAPSTDEDDITIFVNYISSGNDDVQETFLEGEILETDHPDSYTATVGVTSISKPTTTPSIGKGSAFSVAAGSYFVNGFAVRNEEQTIALDKYATDPTYEVGFNVIESFVDSTMDESLLDNSQGAANFAAPGADRFKIDLVLTRRPWGDVDTNFILLATIQQGNILGKPDQTIKWKWLYDILAKRTYDESGNYIVRDFPIVPMEYWNDVEVDGVWDQDVRTGRYPPVPGEGSDVELTLEEADDLYAVRVDPGLAYVQGYEVGLKHPMYVYGEKPRTTKYFENSVTTITKGYNAEVTNVYGLPDIQNITGDGNTRAFDDIITFRNFTDGYVGESLTDSGRPKNVGNAPWMTYHLLFEPTAPISSICSLKGDGAPIDGDDFKIDDPSGIVAILVPDNICIGEPSPPIIIEDEEVDCTLDGDGGNIDSYHFVDEVGNYRGPDGICFDTGYSINPFDTRTNSYDEIYRERNSMVVHSTRAIKRGDIVNGGTVLVSTEVRPVPSGVVKPRYIKPSDRVSKSGYFNYNSNFNLGVFTSTYFTEFRCVPITDSLADWVVGDLVYGEQSNAIGIVELGSTSKVLLLSNILGQFQPGEDIIQGGKSGRIIREGEITGLQFFSAGEDGKTISLANETEVTFSALGTEVTLTKARGELEMLSYTINITEKGQEVLKNFPYPEGTSLNTRVSTEVITTPGKVEGYAVQLDYKISNSLAKSKAFYSPLVDTNDFSADIAIQNRNNTEIVDLANGSLFSGNATYNFVTCDNLGGDASDQLIAGDIVNFIDDAGQSVNRLVMFCTKSVGYGSFRSPSRIYFTTALPNEVSGRTLQRIRTKTTGTSDETLLFQLPTNTVKSLESDNLKTGIDYQVYREFTQNVPGGSRSVTLTTLKSNEVFINNPALVSVTIAKDSATPGSEFEGRQLYIPDMDTSTDSGRKATLYFNFPAGLETGATLKIMMPVSVSDANAKRKVASTETIIIPREDASKRVISLKKSDVFVVDFVGILDQQGEFINILDNFVLDNGQRDNYYDIARLVLKAGKPIVETEMAVRFTYFVHENDGDFFSVDSYTHSAGIEYGAVPYFLPYASDVKSSDSSNVIQLRDAVDFRPVVNTTGTNPSVLASIENGKGTIYSSNFLDASTGGNAHVPRFPIPGTQFKCDIEYYVPRIDSLFIDKSGEFRIVRGLPSESPLPPSEISTGMRLYDISLPAFTFSMRNVKIRKFNYRVYTMKDIADIHRRVDRVEELVALSLLEQTALNLSVRDAVTGLDRYKNGIVVDAFKDHAKGDVNSHEYRNSIDPEHTHLRPPFFKDQVELEDVLQTAESKKLRGYREHDGIVTCDYDEREYQFQPYATRTLKLQPFSQAAYTGFIHLEPQVDTWYDVSRDPFVVIDEDSKYDALQGTSQVSRFNKEYDFGTVWGDWETISPISSTNTQQNGRRGHNIVRSEHQKREADFVFETVKAKDGERVPLYIDNQNWSSSIKISGTLTANNQFREQTRNTVSSATSSIQNTSFGDRVMDMALQDTMRTIPVMFKAVNLKPGTQYHAFFDGVNVDPWVSPDSLGDVYPDGKFRYDDLPGLSNTGFGQKIVADDNGCASGVFLVPNGRPPEPGHVFVQLSEVPYLTHGATRSFSRGQREFALQTGEVFTNNLQSLQAHASAEFVSQAVIRDKDEYIVTTRPMDDVVGESEFDPLAQTFLIDKDEAPEGVFLTGIDVYFEEKDPDVGVELYMVSTDGQVPTNNIIPHSRVYKNSETVLRIVCDLSPLFEFEAAVIEAGTEVVGVKSGARGIVKSTVAFEPAVTNFEQNVTNHVYDLVIDNYVDEFLPGERIIPSITPPDENTYTIAANEVYVTRIDLKAFGGGYSPDDKVIFENPQLPGGEAATGEVVVDSSGRISEVILTSNGYGYTAVPTCAVSSTTGGNALFTVRAREGRHSVDMGVCTSDTSAARTRFKFNAPIYLMGDIAYAFIVKAGASNKYRIFASKLGENQVGLDTKVIAGHGTGPLYVSKNVGLKEAERNMALKYRLQRCKFFSNTVGNVSLQNVPLAFDKLPHDAIQTSAEGGMNQDPVFTLKPSVVKVVHTMHGLHQDDIVYIKGVTGNPGGIPNEYINRIHTVLESEIDYFIIDTGYRAMTSEVNGGTLAEVSISRPFEIINLDAGGMNFSSTNIGISVMASNSRGYNRYNALDAYRKTERVEIQPNNSYYFDGPKQVACYLDEALYNTSRFLNGKRSLEVFLTLQTSNDYISPVFDIQRINATIIRNLVNRPDKESTLYGPIERSYTSNGTFENRDNLQPGDTVEFNTDDGVKSVILTSINPEAHKYTLAGGSLDQLTEASQHTSSLSRATISRSLVRKRKYFNEESTNFGSSYAKWLSRLFVLENPSDGIQVKLSSIFYDSRDIRVYFRPRSVGFDGDVAQINWIPFNGDGSPDNADKIQPRSSKSVDPDLIQASDWQSITWSAQDTAKFDGIAIKIVMCADNPAKVPLIDDMQLICSE